ncbi:MAG: histidine phosphatase family protein [Clostridia bacterium]|nr:histidine phosphatase family protein [Clostridia bacterium]
MENGVIKKEDVKPDTAIRNNVTESGIAGIILAAGYSSRMGSFKPLLPIGDMTALERVSDTLKKAGIRSIIEVTGFQRERLSPMLTSLGIIEAYNPDFNTGMFSSIKAGINKSLLHQAARSSGYFLMLVDCPAVPPEVLKLIIKEHEEHPDSFIVPSYRGKKGHPLFIPSCFIQEILSHEGKGGLKAVTNRHEDKMIRLEVGTEAVVLDMDTPEGYQEVLEYYHRQFNGEESLINIFPQYVNELKGKRLFLIRHGEIRQHREKIFLGQADIPLSEKGREQAKKSALELKNYSISTNRIYTSDLSRAAETAEIIRVGLSPEIEIILEPEFREISLGEWDGLFISEIREKYPDEYKKRGKNLIIFKFGNESENFYDLQYRVMKGFHKLMRQEKEAEGSGDIVIVTHSGVINVILSNLQHKDLGDEIKNHIPNGGVVVIDYS